MARLRVLFEPGLYAFLARRVAGFARQLIQQYLQQRRLASGRLIADPGAYVGSRAILGIEPGVGEGDPARFEIGAGAYIEDGVELGLTPGARLTVGRNSSIHRGCVILGNVRIGANCVLSYNIYAAAGTHVVRERPAWLIKDQDSAFLGSREGESVLIDDDVWIGWGVFVRSGVHVGRGAVIGANAVVLDDIEPYSIVAGNPAKVIGVRLAFSPPAAIDAMRDECLPYFYSGFRDDQASLSGSRAAGVVRLAGPGMLVLRGVRNGTARITGVVEQGRGEVLIRVARGRRQLLEKAFAAGPFAIEVPLEGAETAPASQALRDFTVLAIDAGTEASRVGVASASVDESGQTNDA